MTILDDILNLSFFMFPRNDIRALASIAVFGSKMCNTIKIRKGITRRMIYFEHLGF